MKLFKYIISIILILNLSSIFCNHKLFKLIHERKFDEAIEYLEKNKSNIDVNATDSFNPEKSYTLLITAISWGQYDENNNIKTWNNYNFIKKLFEHPNIDINKKDKSGYSPLSNAIDSGQADLVKLLLEKKAEIDFKKDIYISIYRSGKHSSASADGTNVACIFLEYLLSNDIKINKEDLIEGLARASQLGNEKIVSMLLKLGADVNAKDQIHISPIYYSIRYDCEKIFKILIEAGADVKTKSRDLPILSFLARNSDSEEMFNTILKKFPNIDLNEESNDSTALMVACENNKKKLIELLIKNGADVNYSTKIKRTALYEACEKLNLEIIKLLIENKADINFKDINGKNALHIVCLQDLERQENQNSKNIIEYLIKSGININAKDINDKTVLWTLLSHYLKHLKNIFSNYHNNGLTPTILNEIFIILLNSEIDIFSKDRNKKSILNKLKNIESKNRDSIADPYYINKLKEYAAKFFDKVIQTIYQNDKDNFKKYIIQIGSICIKDTNNNNLLHHAILARNIYFIKLIWSIKPDLISQKNKDGKTPFDLLKESGLLFQDQEILDLLKNK